MIPSYVGSVVQDVQLKSGRYFNISKPISGTYVYGAVHHLDS